MNQRFEILAPVESIHGRRRYLGRRKQGPGMTRLVLLTRLPRRLSTDPTYLAELGVLTSFRHRNIAAVLELQTLANELFLTHELVAGASLSELVIGFNKRNVPFPAGLIGRIVHDVAIALDDAHHFKGPLGEPRPASHRELGLHSVVLSYDGITKIIDFGHPRTPEDTRSALAADLEGLGRLVELSGTMETLGELLSTLQEGEDGQYPRPRKLAEAIAKTFGEGLWTEEQTAQFVRTQFPRRMERLQRLATAEAVWAPPEVGSPRPQRSLDRLSAKAVPEAPVDDAPPLDLRDAPTLIVHMPMEEDGPLENTEVGGPPVLIPAAAAPGTQWLKNNSVTATTLALSALLIFGLLLLPHAQKGFDAALRAPVARAEHVPPGPALGNVLRDLPAPLPMTAAIVPAALALCDVNPAITLEAYGLDRGKLLEPLVIPPDAITEYSNPAAAARQNPAHRRLR
jgi:hypothetical protein